jgi:hypothetical protein
MSDSSLRSSRLATRGENVSSLKSFSLALILALSVGLSVGLSVRYVRIWFEMEGTTQHRPRSRQNVGHSAQAKDGVATHHKAQRDVRCCQCPAEVLQGETGGRVRVVAGWGQARGAFWLCRIRMRPGRVLLAKNSADFAAARGGVAVVSSNMGGEAPRHAEGGVHRDKAQVAICADAWCRSIASSRHGSVCLCVHLFVCTCGPPPPLPLPRM